MQAQTRTGNRKNLIVLSFTLVVVMPGFGMVIPIFPFFVVERMGAGGSALGLPVATGAPHQAALWPAMARYGIAAPIELDANRS